MRITEFNIYEYSLKLNKPLYVCGKEVKSREGLIIEISSEGEIWSYGEIAPLVHLSKETLEEAKAQAKILQSGLINQEIPDHLQKLKGGFKKWLKHFELKPSVQFGIELAVLNLLAGTKKKTLSTLIGQPYHEDIPINGLLYGSKKDVQQQAANLVDQGFKALKLKVGNVIEEEIANVQALNRVIEGKAILHLDANQSWDINKAVHFGHEVGLTTVDYIEEPFKEIHDVPDFFMKTTIPVALDESLQNTKIKDIKSIEGIEILVLKPTILGGIEKTYQLSEEARKMGISVVISSSFESSVGILALAHLASICSRHQGAGLDTLKWFNDDTLNNPVVIEHGKINIRKRNIFKKDINFNLLMEVKL